MKISDGNTIEQIQQAFNDMFPGLKIEFYDKRHEKTEGSPADAQYESTLSIGEIRDVEGTQEVMVDPEMTVAQLEANFRDRLGLNIQIFRRSNSIWLQTSTTDNWTLKEQNRKGLASIQREE
jgi:hypothetical protein